MHCYYFIGRLFCRLAIFCCLAYWHAFALRPSLYGTVSRGGEILALTPADIDLEKATIRINKNYQNVSDYYYYNKKLSV